MRLPFLLAGAPIELLAPMKTMSSEAEGLMRTLNVAPALLSRLYLTHCMLWAGAADLPQIRALPWEHYAASAVFFRIMNPYFAVKTIEGRYL